MDLSNLSVVLPLADLLDLLKLPGEVSRLDAENKQLRRELEGLRGLYFELLNNFADFKRERIEG